MSRYLWLNASLSQGGSERVMTLLANAFAASGEETYMALLREGKEAVYDVDPRLNVRQFHYSSKNKLIILAERCMQLRRLIRKVQPDYVISFMWDINGFALLSCLGLKKKVIVSERAHPKMGTQGLLRRITQNWLYRLAYCVVFQTKDVSPYYPPEVQRRSVVIPNPINPDLPDIWAGERDKEIVAAGRFTEQKNFVLLLESFAEFHKDHPEWKLTLYGEGPQESTLRECVKKHDLDGFVNFPGFVADLPGQILRAGMYVNSSDFEGISNVMLEAMAMGLPCICTDCPVGGAALTIKDGKNGFLTPVGDREAMTRAMKLLADDGELAARVGQAAGRIRERFSIEKVAGRWKSICR